jgi:apolipoprotein D and lipocalin family protein
VIGALGISALAGCAPDPHPLPLASNVDMSRYAGRWYVIANIPYFAENGNVGSYFDITPKPFTPPTPRTSARRSRPSP